MSENIYYNKCSTRKFGTTKKSTQSAVYMVCISTWPPSEHRKPAHDFWWSPGISRATGNKKDMFRKRLTVRTYVNHLTQIFEKTKTEVYLEFKTKYWEVKCNRGALRDVSRSLSLLQGAKTKLLVAVDSKSKHACCFRPAWNSDSKSWLQKEKAFIFSILGHLDDSVKQTLCAKPEGQDYHLFNCSNR